MLLLATYEELCNVQFGSTTKLSDSEEAQLTDEGV